MRVKMTWVLGLASLLLMTSVSYALPQGRMMGPGHMMRGQGNIIPFLTAHQEELGLTDEQLGKIKDLAYANEKKMIQLRKDGSELHLELKKLMQETENRDYSQIKNLLTAVAEKRHEGLIQRLMLQDEIHKILTPEQQEAVKSLRKEAFMQKDRRGRIHRRPFQRSFRFQDWNKN